jgi:hypothetical protein
MMKKLIATTLIASMLTTTSAYSQEQPIELPQVDLVDGEVDPGSAVSPMKKLQKAPFSGVLLSPKLLAIVLAKLKSIDDRTKLAASEATEKANEVCRSEKSLSQIQNDTQVKILNARIADNERIMTMYEKSLEEERQSQTDPGVWIGLGAIGGAAVTVLTVFAVAQSMK